MIQSVKSDCLGIGQTNSAIMWKLLTLFLRKEIVAVIKHLQNNQTSERNKKSKSCFLVYFFHFGQLPVQTQGIFLLWSELVFSASVLLLGKGRAGSWSVCLTRLRGNTTEFALFSPFLLLSLLTCPS